MPRELRATRYLTKANEGVARFIVEELDYLDYAETLKWYGGILPKLGRRGRALLGANDRYFLFTSLLKRRDALNPWLFARCREVEDEPDGCLDLWARYHYKSSIITFAGGIQEILVDPEITIAIFSHTKPIARAFLSQIMQELETNDRLKRIYDDVLWADPRKQAPKWGLDRGIVVKRRGNPKEATVEAHGLVDGQPVSRHYMLRIYDDVVTAESVTNPEMIKKTTDRWELSDNLATTKSSRRWHAGTRYNFGDTYGIIIEEGRGLKPRIYPATDDGTLKGSPVFLSDKRWAEIKDTQRSTVSAQMLLNPVAGNEAMFQSAWFRPYEVRPAVMNVYIMCDPSKGRGQRSDRTAIAVIGIDTAGNKYLLDGYRHRMKLSERWAALKALHKKWTDEPGVQLVSVGYEQYGQLDDLTNLEEYMEREKYSFALIELSTPESGGHSKKDRVERLEPDLRGGRFYLPGVVYHPDFGGRDGAALWDPWTEEKAKAAEQAGKGSGLNVGQIVYRPLLGATKLQRACEVVGQQFRVVTPIKRFDESRNVYDLTRMFMEEAIFFPFAPKDDLIDVTSRIYDMQARPAVQIDVASLEPVAHPDA